jgi:hypothetical protein
MALFVFIGNRLRKQQQSVTTLAQTPSAATLANPPVSAWDYHDFFRTAYYSPLQSDVEKRMSDAASIADPNNRETFLLKVLGIGAISYTYDTIWWTIYGSQLAFLLDLNQHQGRLPASRAREYYDKAKAEFPNIYLTYTFDNWLSFMAGQILIFRHPSEMIEITQRGKDFLKYLLHWGKDPSVKKL